MKIRVGTLMFVAAIMALILAMTVHHEEMSHRVANYQAREFYHETAVKNALKTESELHQAKREIKRLEARVKSLTHELLQERLQNAGNRLEERQPVPR